MWSNWKLPITYKYLPELMSDSPDAIDELTGAKFSDIRSQKEHGLKLLKYLHEHGVKVWQWIPTGCIPTTYSAKYPQAMSPGSKCIPCFTDPVYKRYVDALVTEMIETYPFDGVVLIRDDNGGICNCSRCQDYVLHSRTKNPMWEQYLIIYDLLRSKGFKGDIAVYPYFDTYKPDIDTLLPKDMMIVGHGSGLSVLCHDYEQLGLMGETWLDNLFIGFRQPSAAKMKRLLSDRGVFWVGGAYCATELPWLSIGAFGTEPTRSVNTLRYWYGCRAFSKRNALDYVKLSQASEKLWDIYHYPMLPADWFQLKPDMQKQFASEGKAWLKIYRSRLSVFKKAASTPKNSIWFAHMDLFGSFFETQLDRLELLCQMRDVVVANKASFDSGHALSENSRKQLISLHQDAMRQCDVYKMKAVNVPGNMMKSVRETDMTVPFKEVMAGWDNSLADVMDIKPLAGTIEASDVETKAGKDFTLRIKLQNKGIWPWTSDEDFSIKLIGEVKNFNLPERWKFNCAPIVFGDMRTIELHGIAPKSPGNADIKFEFYAPTPIFRVSPLAVGKCSLVWN